MRDTATDGEGGSENAGDQQEESLLDLIAGFGIDQPVETKNSKPKK